MSQADNKVNVTANPATAWPDILLTRIGSALDIKESDESKVVESEEYDNDWDDQSQDEDWWDSDEGSL